LAPKARILAIDEQLYLRSFLEGVISEAGYAIQTAENEARATALAAERMPDLVIADPAQLGPDVPSAISRLRTRWPEASLLAVSAAADPRWGVSAMRAGAADALQKPLDRDSLLRALATLTAAARPKGGDAKLVDENVALLARLALIERGLALVGLRSPEEILARFADLLREETGTEDLVLYAGRRADGSLARVPLNAAPPPAGTPACRRDEAGATHDALRAGQAVHDAANGVLLVPCAREERLVAVARIALGKRATVDASTGTACARVGALAATALEQAQERERLGRASFRDPQTGLPGRDFLEEVGRTEVHKAHRFGRRLSLLCVDLEGFDPSRDAAVLPALVAGVARTLRTTDVLACDELRRFWVLVTDTDPLGGVVLKRRIGQRLRDILREAKLSANAALGVANFPVDGESLEALIGASQRRVQEEHASVVRELGIVPETPLSAMGARLLDRARWLPRDFVGEAAELLIGDLACRPRDRGLLFLAPGPERPRFLAPLTALGDIETATEVFLATDGDTIPSGPAITALSLPPNFSADTSWIVRFGEGPPYALVAGKPRADGARPVFHSNDPVLVEHMTFRLRSETGFGMRAG
jgi:DNA-binding response OmpR family regulator/GGDEF domain-containing protein